jgi:hypothetical protein
MAPLEIHETFTLGELIDALDRVNIPGDWDVVYDFECLVPTTLDSWRWDYAELALGYGLANGCYGPTPCVKEDPTVDSFLKYLQNSVGNEVYGWKGGDYIIRLETPVWVANSGNVGFTAIIGIEKQDTYENAVILTKKILDA